jgi:ATP-dependent Lon protease
MSQKRSSLRASQYRRKKKGVGKMHDDIDDRGNIKNLIEYDSDSTDQSSSMDLNNDEPIAYRTRNSTMKHNKHKNKTTKKDLYTMDEDDENDGGDEQEDEDDSDEEDDDYDEEEDDDYDEEDEDEDEEDEDDDESEEDESESEEEEDEEDDKIIKNKVHKLKSSKKSKDSKKSKKNKKSKDTDDMEDGIEDMPPGFSISFGGIETKSNDSMIPKRYNMKKESDNVKKFVKLVTKPSDENTIDNQIDQFKALSSEFQTKMLTTLESRSGSSTNPTQNLMFKLMTMNLPSEIQATVLSKYQALQKMDSGSSEYFKNRAWLEKLSNLPLGIYKELPVKLEDGSDKCNEFMAKARKSLDDAIFGQEEAKLQILQFIGTKIANPTSRGLSLLLAGPPGIGKTSLIKNGIAKALEWPFQFISLGGDSDASTYTGHQLVYESSHCGKIVNSLITSKSMSMILMFDELDKISTTSKGEEVHHMLIHLTDPVQNGEFEDKYLAGIPIDLSRSMFIFSANDVSKIDRILLDRFVVIQLQGYSSKDKITIADNYIIPQALKELNLDERVAINKDVIPYILENYAKEESGVRELKRCIEQIVQKINMLRLFNTKDLPFHIKDFNLPFVLKKEHVDIFLKKKDLDKDLSYLKMYS